MTTKKDKSSKEITDAKKEAAEAAALAKKEAAEAAEAAKASKAADAALAKKEAAAKNRAAKKDADAEKAEVAADETLLLVSQQTVEPSVELYNFNDGTRVLIATHKNGAKSIAIATK